MTLLPTCTIEGSVTFTVEGKFDARFNSPVFVLASHKVEEQVSPREYMDASIKTIKWRETTKGLEDGLNDFLSYVSDSVYEIIEEVPHMLEQG